MGVPCYSREVKKTPEGRNLKVRRKKTEKRNQGLEGLNEMQRDRVSTCRRVFDIQ